MTDDQYESLRTLILDLAVRIEALELHLARQDAAADLRHALVYEWCAPASYKAMAEAVSIDIPDDLRKFFAG